LTFSSSGADLLEKALPLAGKRQELGSIGFPPTPSRFHHFDPQATLAQVAAPQ
jgi:hypothetical protein